MSACQLRLRLGQLSLLSTQSQPAPTTSISAPIGRLVSLDLENGLMKRACAISGPEGR
jgi:hypothetical protein